MIASQSELQSQVIGLAEQSFETFCKDISGMFGVEMECAQQEPCTETVEGLKKRFEKFVAVNHIKAEGALDGDFQLIFDQEGLFTLAGIITMEPEQKIRQNRKSGSKKDAQEMADAIGEAGNLLVGSWDRIFREEMEEHSHFAQSSSFVGLPWDNPKKKLGLNTDEQCLYVPFEMTIEPYSAFHCGVIFPHAVFGKSEADIEEAEKAAAEAAKAEETEKVAAEATKAEEEEKAEEAVPEETEVNEKEPKEEAAGAEEGTEEAAKDVPTEEAVVEEAVAAEETDSAASAEPGDSTEAKPNQTDDLAKPTVSSTNIVSETIQKMSRSTADLPGEQSLAFSALNAQDIMQTTLTWCAPSDSIQQVQAKMQEADTGYVMVGVDGVLEGIISRSAIVSAISIYLRPMFAKWKRPTDDATLQIRAKWIMSRPVHTISADTSCAVVMENMCRFGIRALPVTDEQNRIIGLVTVFNFFQTLLSTDSGVATAGKTIQVPVLA